MQKSKVRQILEILIEKGVDFIVVGGVAAVLRGAPLNTLDLDLVHSTEPDNVERLVAALAGLDARYRAQPEHQFRPDRSHLSSPGHQLLLTRLGPLDLLGSIGTNRSYRDLLAHAPEIDLGEGLRVRTLDLETQIAVKEEVGDDKDLAVLPLLRRTLAESRRPQ